MADRQSYGGFEAGRWGFPWRPEITLSQPEVTSPTVAEWDGITYFTNDLFTTYPSQSDTEYLPVVGTGTFYPIALTRAEAMAWYWKIRTIDIAGSVSATNGVDTVSASDPTSSISADWTRQFEKWVRVPISEQYTGGEAVINGEIRCEIVFSIWGANMGDVQDFGELTSDFHPMLEYNGMFYPFIFLMLGAALVGVDPAPSETEFVYSIAVDGFATETIDIFGKTLTLYRGGGGGSSVSALITDIECSEYLPYADNNGDPMYDTTTGAALISAF